MPRHRVEDPRAAVSKGVGLEKKKSDSDNNNRRSTLRKKPLATRASTATGVAHNGCKARDVIKPEHVTSATDRNGSDEADEFDGSDAGGLASSTKTRSDEQTSEEETDGEEEVLERKCLPHRETRGRRLQMLLGEDAELDREFWGHSTWHEEANDEDWVPGEEDRVNDSTTSSGDSSGTESDATTTADAEQALELDEKLDKKRRLATQRNRVYRNPAQRPAQSSARLLRPPAKTARYPRPLPPAPAKPEAETLYHKAQRESRHKILSQEEHLRLAELYERDNTKQLNDRIDLGNQKKEFKEQKLSSTIWSGPMELLLSWSSDRLIEGEEQSKAKLSADVSSKEASSSKGASSSPLPYCRQLLFFADFTNPESSSLPEMYSNKHNVRPSSKRLDTECSIYPSQRAKYYDPRVGAPFSNAAAFRELRRRYDAEALTFVKACFSPVGTKLKQIFEVLNAHDTLAQHFGAPMSIAAKSPSSELAVSPTLDRLHVSSTEANSICALDRGSVKRDPTEKTQEQRQPSLKRKRVIALDRSRKERNDVKSVITEANATVHFAPEQAENTTPQAVQEAAVLSVTASKPPAPTVLLPESAAYLPLQTKALTQRYPMLFNAQRPLYQPGVAEEEPLHRQPLRIRSTQPAFYSPKSSAPGTATPSLAATIAQGYEPSARPPSPSPIRNAAAPFYFNSSSSSSSSSVAPPFAQIHPYYYPHLSLASSVYPPPTGFLETFPIFHPYAFTAPNVTPTAYRHIRPNGSTATLANQQHRCCAPLQHPAPSSVQSSSFLPQPYPSLLQSPYSFTVQPSPLPGLPLNMPLGQQNNLTSLPTHSIHLQHTENANARKMTQSSAMPPASATSTVSSVLSPPRQGLAPSSVPRHLLLTPSSITPKPNNVSLAAPASTLPSVFASQLLQTSAEQQKAPLRPPG